MNSGSPSLVIPMLLDLLDAQRENALGAMVGLTNDQIWQRPGEKEWCLGEILNHNVKVMASAIPSAKIVWRYFRWYWRATAFKAL